MDKESVKSMLDAILRRTFKKNLLKDCEETYSRKSFSPFANSTTADTDSVKPIMESLGWKLAFTVDYYTAYWRK